MSNSRGNRGGSWIFQSKKWDDNAQEIEEKWIRVEQSRRCILELPFQVSCQPTFVSTQNRQSSFFKDLKSHLLSKHKTVTRSPCFSKSRHCKRYVIKRINLRSLLNTLLASRWVTRYQKSLANWIKFNQWIKRIFFRRTIGFWILYTYPRTQSAPEKKALHACTGLWEPKSGKRPYESLCLQAIEIVLRLYWYCLKNLRDGGRNPDALSVFGAWCSEIGLWEAR
jgi:hypothetical protein